MRDACNNIPAKISGYSVRIHSQGIASLLRTFIPFIRNDVTFLDQAEKPLRTIVKCTLSRELC